MDEGTTGHEVGAPTSSEDPRAIYHRPERAFDHGLPDVPVHVFADELDLVLDPATPTGLVPLDLSGPLRLSYPATTPILLARYLVLRAGDSLTHRFECTGEVHYVLRGAGTSTNGEDSFSWGEGDCSFFPGGGETTHVASVDSLLVSVTNEPELAFAFTAPRADSPLVATLFRSWRIEAELAVVHDAPGEQATAGKSVSLTTATMDSRLSGALLPSMMVALNSLEGGGIQRRHRHNSAALTVPVAGDATYSLIGDEKVAWQNAAVIVTPPRVAHSHVNEGTEMMRALVVQDGPVFYNCRSVGFEWTDETF